MSNDGKICDDGKNVKSLLRAYGTKCFEEQILVVSFEIFVLLMIKKPHLRDNHSRKKNSRARAWVTLGVLGGRRDSVGPRQKSSSAHAPPLGD